MRVPPVPRCAVLLAGLGISVCASGPACAQMDSREAISLQNQILELRHEVEQNQGQGGNGGVVVAPPIGGGAQPAPGDAGGLAPQLLDRVQTLEQQVRDMRGELDQLANQVQQQNAALAKQIGDLGFAVQQNHGGGAGAGAVAAGGTESGVSGPAAPVPAAPPPVPVRQTPETLLAAGNAALNRHDYPAAEADARQVLAGPRGPRQIDAQFLLGQSLAGQRQFQQSAVAYYDAYNRAPRSGRAPDALLGVGAAMLALGDKPSACQALGKMHSEFPQPAPRARAAYVALRGRAGCR